MPSHRLSSFRPLLVTTNTEFWGGGKCTRYDVHFDTVIGRASAGCFSIHCPPAFWYEFMRIDNATKQLMLPHSAPDRQDHLEHILKMKNVDRFHTLFLVKICFMEGRYKADAVVRVLFFDLLQQKYSEMNKVDGGHRTVDGLSECRRNMEKKKKMQNEGLYEARGRDQTFGYQGVRDGAVHIAMKYKFMISMENSRTKGYVLCVGVCLWWCHDVGWLVH